MHGRATAPAIVLAPTPSALSTIGTNLTFQEGANGYTGTEDTALEEERPNDFRGNEVEIQVQTESDGDLEQGLIAFTNIFGSGAGQIPFGAVITSASLTLEVDDTTGGTVTLHRMLAPWTEASTWNSLSNGVSTDNVEALATPDASVTAPSLGPLTLAGLEATLQAWSDGDDNYGWLLMSDDSNDFDVDTSENSIASHRPLLQVTYILPSISGTILEDIDGDANLADAVGVENAVVYLFSDDGDGVPDAGDSFVDLDVTDSNGDYTLGDLSDGTYWVVVDSISIGASQGYNSGFGASYVWADQTYGSPGAVSFDGSYSYLSSAGALYGGMRVEAADVDSSDLDVAEHVTRVVVAGASIEDVDSAFSFSVVTRTGDGDEYFDDRSLQGSLRQFIGNSNAISGTQTSQFALSTSDSNYDVTGNGEYLIALASGFENDLDDTVILDASSQAGYAGSPIVEIDASGAGSLSATFRLQADNSELRGFSIYGASGDAIVISGADNVSVQNNWIGLSVAGSGIGNGDEGIQVSDGSDNSLIGGTGANDGNVVAYSDGAGVMIYATAGSGNSILGNSIYANNELGIDLVDPSFSFGVTENDALDADTGVNGLQNFPLLISANSDGSGRVYVAGTMSAAASTTYRVEFFASATTHSSGHGEGQQYLGFTNVTTDASGIASFSADFFTTVSVGSVLSSTATAPDGSTSEFSSNSDALRMGVLVVDTTIDSVDGSVTSIADLLANRGADNRISLREALLATNATANAGTPDEIRFGLQQDDPNRFYFRDDGIADSLSLTVTTTQADADISDFDPDLVVAGASWFRFQPTSALPSIDEALIIDGYSQDGAATNTSGTGTDAVLKIVIDGALSGNADGFVVNASGTEIQGLVITGNFRAGVVVNSSNAVISGNYIGTDASSSQSDGQLEIGIELAAGASGNLIGGSTPAARNVISGTTQAGVSLTGATTNTNTIEGNYIGTDAQGTVGVVNSSAGIALSNGTFDNEIRDNVISGNDEGIDIDGDTDSPTGTLIVGNLIGTDASGAIAVANSVGVLLRRGATGNTIGGIGAANRNIISGNTTDGIRISDSNSTLNYIYGNYIGTDISGMNALANSDDGIQIYGHENFIGGTVSGQGNVISGNIDNGIQLSEGYDNVVQGNIIGLAADGVTALGNDDDGVRIELGATDNLIGGSTAAARNLISGNLEYGVRLTGTGTSANTVSGNYIGTDTSGALAAGNLFGGVLIEDGASSNTIGGTAADTGNVIAHNNGAGVLIASDAGAANGILTNEIYASSGLGIDIQGAGFDLPNLISASTDGTGSITISGTIDTAASTTVRIELFANSTADPGGSGEGEVYLGFVNVTTDATGHGTFSVTLAEAVSAGAFISATSTDSANNTSEFSVNVVAGSVAPIIDLDADNSSGQTGADYTTTFTENGVAVNVADADALLTDTDSNVSSLTVTITNLLDGALETLSADTTGTNITASYDSGTGILTLSGSDTAANYQLVLRTVTYSNSAAEPNTTSRTLEFQASDGTLTSNTATATIVIASVNDAPVLTPATPSLPTITEDALTNSGQQISVLLGTSVTDDDSGAVEGIAITGLVSSNGIWQYSLDGTNWVSVGTVTNNSALLLRATDFVRFVPDGENADTASFTFRAWDQTAGSAGTNADTTTNGGTTAFSTATDSASITVTAVNDAPVLTPATPTLPTITEDELTNSGQQISVLLGVSVTDVDSGAVEGIAITGLTSSNGTWQYSLDGTNWTNVGTVADNSALLLRATDFVRFVPDGNNADTASFTFRAWDQTSGTAGTNVDTTTNGGTTAFSSASDSASIAVTAVNDAPVLTPATPTLPTITEDELTNSGLQISMLLGTSVTDVDSGAVEGIAITGLTSSNGTWQYSLDGTNWVNVGAVANNNALLLRATDFVRFVPDGENADTASFTFRAWDQTSGTAGTNADTTTNGGTTAFSSASDSASITVTAVNEAPLLTPSTPTLPTITEDELANSGQQISVLLGTSVTDSDSGAVEGIAITGLASSNGTWQFSLDGTNWTNVGTVADNSALLLRATDFVRFVPDGENADTASFTFRAWDQTSGTAGTNVDTTTNGGTTAFSSASDSASIAVTAVNDAPVLTPAAPTLPTVTEDATTNSGLLVSTLLGSSVTDVDSGAVEGIAITGLTSSNGTWQYSLDGTNWTNVGTVADNSALLLRATDFVRFVPDGDNADTASFTFRAWDQTSGTAGTNADTTTNGGTTAFSTASDSASITVTAVNDAPVLTPATPTLPTITEDALTNSGLLVSTLLGSSVSDVDSGAVEGIAITGLTSSNGTWQFSLDGTNWTNVGTVADNSALLLRATDFVRFVPDGENADTASFTFRAWDQTSGTAGTNADTTANGGTTAFSTASDSASITITAVNDAPVLTPAAPVLPTITEDALTNSGQQISVLLGTSVTDVDSGAVEGIAITGLTSSNGTWQYSLDGTNWTNVGTVADNSALLLRATDFVRFVPDGNNADTASFTFRAWDQTSGTAGTNADTTTNGGTTAFSTASDSASITVTAVNDAPVLTPATPTLPTITEDALTNSGLLVSTLLGSSVTDVDSGAVEGIAITGLTSSNGTWQYSLDGTNWTNVGTVADNSALLLRATDFVRFVPDGENADTASFTFRAWDQTSGTAGTNDDTTTNGGTTAFSTAIDSASITVTAVNDAPVLTPATPTLPTITEDALTNSGQQISVLLGTFVTDVDSGAVEGIAITGLTSSNGTWQYSLDGTNWTNVGTVADNSALLLRATDFVRFVPDGDNADTASFTFRAWDQTSGTAGTNADTTTNGGTTAFSTASDSASITVTAVNDAPVLTPATPTLPTITEDALTNSGLLVSTLLGSSVTDVDSGAVEGIAITGLTSSNGTWQYSLDGTNWTNVGAVADNSALLLRATDFVRFVPDGDNADTASFTFRAWDQTSGTAGTNADTTTNGGATAFSTASDSASITVTAVNDAPVLTPATPTLPTITEDALTNSGLLVSTLLGSSVSDVDSGAVEGIAITGLTSSNGTWQYSLDGTNWTNVGTVADNSALLLRATDFVRFVPDGNNADTASFTFRAWDQTSGTEGTNADTTTNGGTTAFSTASDSASITVTAVNDAPVLTPATPTLPTITEDATTNSGLLVSTLLGSSVTDVDSGAVEGIAITGLTSSNGTWQYSLDGTNWTNVGTVADNSALLLRATDFVRFVPDGENADTASFTFRAWDQTSGTAGTNADTTTNGGATAFSTAIDSASITVTAVNDAPVLTPATPALPTITEDATTNSGLLVSTLLGSSVTDVDSGAVEGIAITGLTSSNGTWQYSLDGSNWTNVGTVADNSALLLRATDFVRFVPDGENADTASFTFRAWDQTSGTEGTNDDTTTNGGTTAFSTAIDSASITVTAVNDAPVLTPAAPTLPTITEDALTNSGQQISVLLGTSVTDVDSGAVEGIAITGLTSSNGTWQYSLDGTNWTNVGTVADNSALLLRATDFVRFVPDGDNADTASFTFRAWDQTSGTAGTNADTTTNGGTTAFSTASDSASITVTAVNDAPVLTPAAPTLPTITEDATTNSGLLVSTLLGSSVTDVDSGAVEGIAITALTSSNGTWQYSLDGTNWTNVGTVADNSALLLRATDFVRFVPDGENADTASFTFRAWDQTSGTAGTSADASTNGGTTAFSTASDSASITVTAVNDAPVLTPATPTLPTITEDATTNSGLLVSTLLGSSVTDVDSGAVEGIAITGLTSSNGTWQYSLDGTNWTNVGTVADNSALLLRATDFVRFVPDGDNADTASFTFRAWDQTSGTAGTNADTTTNGGATAFSTAIDSASITVTAVNDAPVLTPATPTLPTITEDELTNSGQQISVLLGTSVTDVDSGAVEGIAITGLTSSNGTWQYSLDGTNWTNVGTVADNSALLLRSTDFVRFVPDGENADTASFTFRAWDQTSGTAGTNADTTTNGGATAFSTAIDSASITVTAVNDAPGTDTCDSDAANDYRRRTDQQRPTG